MHCTSHTNTCNISHKPARVISYNRGWNNTKKCTFQVRQTLVTLPKAHHIWELSDWTNTKKQTVCFWSNCEKLLQKCCQAVTSLWSTLSSVSTLETSLELASLSASPKSDGNIHCIFRNIFIAVGKVFPPTPLWEQRVSLRLATDNHAW